jgi:hypothetical protein
VKVSDIEGATNVEKFWTQEEVPGTSFIPGLGPVALFLRLFTLGLSQIVSGDGCACMILYLHS